MPDATIDEILQFAATYDAYERLAAGPEQLESLLGSVYADIERSSVVPQWVRIDLARALLFYASRKDHFGGGYGPHEPMRALVDRIRTLRADERSVVGLASNGEFADSWEYSADRMYRWWYERRWSDGPSLCFVGLNPSTGDTDGKPRPTLAKVVGWARREGCSAVVVVNLFAFRATKPDVLFGTDSASDIVGDRSAEIIRQRSAGAKVTLAAWGADPRATARAIDVLPLLTDPQCVGKTKAGAPRHPLYVAAAQRFEPYP